MRTGSFMITYLAAIPEYRNMRGWREIVSSFAILLCGLTLMAMRLETSAPVNSSKTHEHTTKVFTYPQPPQGFDPLAASDAELAKYGFPPRPDPQKAPALYEQWKRMVTVPRGGKSIMQSTKIYNGTEQHVGPNGER